MIILNGAGVTMNMNTDYTIQYFSLQSLWDQLPSKYKYYATETEGINILLSDRRHHDHDDRFRKMQNVTLNTSIAEGLTPAYLGIVCFMLFLTPSWFYLFI